MISKIGYRPVLMGNTILQGLIFVSLIFVSESASLWLLSVLLFLMGGANSLQFTAMNTLTLKDLDEKQSSSGNSLLSMIMIFSMSFGVAVAAALLALFNHVSEMEHYENPLFAFHASFICIGIISIITSVIFAQLSKENRN